MQAEQTGTKRDLDPAALQHAARLLRTALAELGKPSFEKVGPEAPIDALGLSSMAMMEFLGQLEEHLDRELGDEDLLNLSTVGDLLHLVAANVAPPHADD